MGSWPRKLAQSMLPIDEAGPFALLLRSACFRLQPGRRRRVFFSIKLMLTGLTVLDLSSRRHLSSEGMAKDDVDLSHHYEDLIRHYNNEEFEKALRSVNAILKETPSDQKALHSKAVCLIQTSKFSEALEIAKQVDDKKAVILPLVYALYRLNNYGEIIDILGRQAGELPLELKELKAQTLYKLEKYDECLDIYKELLKKQRDDLDSERQCNFLAVLTQLQLSKGGSVPSFAPSAFETYELLFNAAALEIAKGNHAEAEKKLRRAETLFLAQAAEDQLAPQKIKSELATLKIQMLRVALQKAKKQPVEKPAGFSVESVENNFLNQFAKLKKKPKKEAEVASPKAKPTGAASGIAGDKDLKKKKRKRKPRLPKNYDPNAKLDPERWLPKHERSTYKKKKDKRGGGNAMKGTQGSTNPEVTVPSTPKTQPSQAPAQPAGPRTQKPQAAAKKQAKKKRK